MFWKKLSRSEIQCIESNIRQLKDNEKLINTTVNPAVFFGRINFTLDLLLHLSQYEKYKIFKGATPTHDYNIILENIELTVDKFIDRALESNQKKIETLKTDGAKRKNYEKFTSALIAAFDCANTFWTGNAGFPHYTGPLYTWKNYERVKAIYESSSKFLSEKQIPPSQNFLK